MGPTIYIYILKKREKKLTRIVYLIVFLDSVLREMADNVKVVCKSISNGKNRVKLLIRFFLNSINIIFLMYILIKKTFHLNINIYVILIFFIF